MYTRPYDGDGNGTLDRDELEAMATTDLAELVPKLMLALDGSSASVKKAVVELLERMPEELLN